MNIKELAEQEYPYDFQYVNGEDIAVNYNEANNQREIYLKGAKAVLDEIERTILKECFIYSIGDGFCLENVTKKIEELKG